MSNLTQHPEDGLLLRYIDGELPGPKARQIQRHLEACWKCRTEIEALQATVADCMHYRKNVLEAHLPEAPLPWGDLSREMERMDAAAAAEPFWKHMLPRAPGLRWGLAAACAIALAFAIVYQLRETPSVQAAALLKRAVAAAASQPPHAMHSIRYRTRSMTASAALTSAAWTPALSARIAKAHYEIADPLSARAFQAWRDSEAVKTDEISTVAGPQASDGNCYRIRTLSPEGELAAASLTLRAADLRPVESKLEFRDQDWIEFTELTEPTAVSDGATVARNVEVPVRSSVPSGKAAFAPKLSASISDELQVLSALHQIGADLGDPIDVKRSGGRVLVSGVGVPAQRQKQIHDMLDSLPNVSVNFANPAAVSSEAPAVSDGAAVSDAGGGTGSRLQTRLEQQLGGKAEFEKFSAQILDTNEAAMSRAYALRSLAQRFPAPAEAELDAAGQRELRAMAREHLDSLAAQVTAMSRLLNPVLTGLGGAPAKAAASPSAGWQPAAEDLFRASRRVEVLLSQLLGVAPQQASTTPLPTLLASALDELRAEIQECGGVLNK